MPEMNGYEFIEHYKDTLRAANIPIYLFTTSLPDGSFEKHTATEPYVKGYIVKSIDSAELKDLRTYYGDSEELDRSFIEMHEAGRR